MSKSSNYSCNQFNIGHITSESDDEDDLAVKITLRVNGVDEVLEFKQGQGVMKSIDQFSFDRDLGEEVKAKIAKRLKFMF